MLADTNIHCAEISDGNNRKLQQKGISENHVQGLCSAVFKCRRWPSHSRHICGPWGRSHPDLSDLWTAPSPPPPDARLRPPTVSPQQNLCSFHQLAHRLCKPSSALIIHRQRKVRQNSEAWNKRAIWLLETRPQFPAFHSWICRTVFLQQQQCRCQKWACLLSHRKPKKKLWAKKCSNTLPRSGDYCRTLCLSHTCFGKEWPNGDDFLLYVIIWLKFLLFCYSGGEIPPRSFPIRGNAGGMTHWDRFESHFLMKKILRDLPKYRGKTLKLFI